MEKFAHFCQSCRAANEPGEKVCRKCGTRLMIITFPPSLRHEEEQVSPTFYEDHLLERVSLLEFRLKQLSEQLAMSYEFISRQSAFFEKDHLLIASFIEAVRDADPNLSERLSEELASNYERKKSEVKNENKQKREVDEILSSHENNNAELFTHLVWEGIELLEKNEEKQAFRTLERASLLSPKNIALHTFIAEKLFHADKFDVARRYLEKVYKLSPQNKKALLLLSVIYANDYEAEKSRKILSLLVSFPDTMVCANYIWGMLAVCEGHWNEAIVAFKESLDESNSAEINYLIGSACFQIKNYASALEFLEASVLEDEKFADAWFVICEIYKHLNKPTKSENARQMAFDAKEAGAKCLKFMSKNNSSDLEVAIPFLHIKDDKKQLLTNGSLRMTKFFKKLVFDSID